MTTATVPNTIGKIVQVIGPVIDVEFEAEQLPDALRQGVSIAEQERPAAMPPVGERERYAVRARPPADLVQLDGSALDEQAQGGRDSR